MKHYHSDHFDLSSFNYCKVYFRSRLSIVDVTNNSKTKDFILSMIIILISYVIFYCGWFAIVQNWLDEKIDPWGTNEFKKSTRDKRLGEKESIDMLTAEDFERKIIEKEKSNKCRICIIIWYYVVSLLLTLVNLALLFFIVPFFPILIAIFK